MAIATSLRLRPKAQFGVFVGGEAAHKHPKQECPATPLGRRKLGGYITHLAPEKMQELHGAIGFALGFDVLE